VIIIYTKKNCEKCTLAKKRIQEKGLPYIEKSVESPDDLVELAMAGVDISEAPIIFNNGEYFTNKNGLFRGIK
jgi:glutaredoxin